MNSTISSSCEKNNKILLKNKAYYFHHFQILVGVRQIEGRRTWNGGWLWGSHYSNAYKFIKNSFLAHYFPPSTYFGYFSLFHHHHWHVFFKRDSICDSVAHSKHPISLVPYIFFTNINPPFLAFWATETRFRILSYFVDPKPKPARTQKIILFLKLI